ncbi:lipopolysaccharide biosynthesis protein [Pseudoalteromonas gelatinilytica]|uniref:lipopolysaccharide biosynthesis protein n=1 Tax=Pseudoalteromonas gelatinilytica TaxID=1703256 RepID=UPI0015FFDE21|nr:oligosaccharide flippase family protein [Pseudoalteromonas profundi]
MRNLFNSNFIRNVIIVASGTAGAQAITLLLTPIITRIYGPSIIGVAGVFSSIVIVLSPLATLSYHYAIVLPKRESEARAIFFLSLKLAVLFSILLLVCILLLNDYLFVIFSQSGVSEYLLFVPFAVFFYSLWQMLEQYLIRQGMFKEKAKAAILHSITFNGLKVIIGFISASTWTFVLITTALGGINSFFLYFFSRNKLKEIKNSQSRIAEKIIFYRYIDFAKYKSPEMAVNAASQGLPIILLASFYGAQAAGYFTLARSILGLPATLIGKSVGDVFYPKISKECNDGRKIYVTVKKSTLYLGLVGLLPFGFVALFGSYIFGFIFGSEWFKSGVYASWLSVWLYFMFINAPCIKTLMVIGKQGFLLAFTLITITLRVFVLFITHELFNDDIYTVAVFAISGAVLNVVLIIISFSLCKGFDNRETTHG